MSTLRVFVSHPSSFLTDHRPHGDGLAAWELLRRLAARGHRFDVAVEHADVRTPVSGITLHPLCPRARFSVLRPPEQVARVAGLLRALERRGASFDLVHQMNPVHAGLSAAAGRGHALVLGPYVAAWPAPSASPSHRGLRGAVHALAGTLMAGLEAVQQRGAARLVLSTEAARAQLVPGVRAERCRVVPYGVDTALFHPPPAPPPGAGIAAVGHLEERKGARVLLEAFRELVTRLPGVHLTFAGEGALRAELESRARDWGLGGSVRFAGALDRPAVARLLREHRVLCVPSLGEPFGLVALEGMASGLPVVATRAGGLQFLVEDGVTGALVPPGDAPALAGALARVLQDAPLAASMGRASRAQAVSRFDWERVAEAWEEVYREAAASGPR
jgi:glycosyltransferase involved in cell wall biosynthesis